MLAGFFERIALSLCFRDKIGPTGQHLPDGADHLGNMLDGIQNDIIIEKNDVAVLPHQLDDKNVAAEIPHFIQVFNFKTKNPLQTRLGDGDNFSVLQVFAKKHAEGRCGIRRGLVLTGQVDQRKRCIGT